MSIGLVLSGGGIRGAAHIGVLKALKEENIQINMISGTSAGSIIAGFYAYGFNSEEMRILANKVSRRYIDVDYTGIFDSMFNLLLRRSINMSGVILGNRLESFFSSVTKGARLQEVRIPLAIVAVDINNTNIVIFTNQTRGLMRRDDYVYVSEASIATAIRASIAIPGIFSPKVLGKMRLVDGGVRANLPVEIMRQMGADRVIGVNLGYSGTPQPQVDNVLEISMQAINLMLYQINRSNLESADVLITPEIMDHGLTDFNKMDYLVDCGYQAGREAMPAIKRLLNMAVDKPPSALFHQKFRA